jgi:hypothetical protein
MTAKTPLFEVISLHGARGPHGFHSNLAMFTIVEAVIGEFVNDGTIVKQQKESTPDDTVEDMKLRKT